MWSAITAAYESLANFAVQHPNYLGAVILPVLEKCSEVCPVFDWQKNSHCPHSEPN